MRIGFFGTPEHSRQLLETIYHSDNEIAFVVTNPDRPKGRKKTPSPSPVKEFAKAHNIPIFQPEKLRDSIDRELIIQIPTDIHIVYAYGQIIPEDVFQSPLLGSINLHGSVLPEYRGASPVQTAIMDGKSDTGFSIQRVAKLVDSGNVLYSQRFPIDDNDNTGSILDRITRLGGERILIILKSGKLEEGLPQNHDLATFCTKILPQDRIVDFHLPQKQVHDKIRALNPNPLAYTTFRDKRILLIRTSIQNPYKEFEENGKNYPPGTLFRVGKKSLFVICGDKNMLSIEELQPEGKNPMKAVDFLNGFSIKEGDIFQ